MLACHVCYTGSLEKGARYGLAEREVEKAKLFWHRGDRTHAQTCLDRIINSHYNLIDLEEVKTKSRKEQMAHAEVSFIVILFCSTHTKVLFQIIGKAIMTAQCTGLF